MNENKQYNTVVTFGTYDLFHIGHLNILERAKRLGNNLVVGVSSDDLNYSKKEKYPVYPQEHRMKIVSALECVDWVFLEESLEKKKEYLVTVNADCLVMGDDWQGKFDWCKDVCDVVYLPRTANISTTQIKEFLAK